MNRDQEEQKEQGGTVTRTLALAAVAGLVFSVTVIFALALFGKHHGCGFHHGPGQMLHQSAGNGNRFKWM